MTDKFTGNRKFYDIENVPNEKKNWSKTNDKNESEELVKYLGKNIIGNDLIFNSPYGKRKVVYCDYIASGRSVKYIEDYIRDEVLPHYGSTHTTSTVTSLQTTLYRHEAREIIRNATRASEHDRVLFVGSGATMAINKLINGLNLTSTPVVFVCPFAHHSSLLPWREIGAEVIRIAETADGSVDLNHLEDQLKKYRNHKSTKIGCFTAASNVTGIKTDDVAITVLLHRYGALAFWDYATAAPYIDIEMNPIRLEDPEGLASKDALFFSMHKFLGGVQTPGVLIAKSSLFQNSSPEVCGGGSIFFVSRKNHRYLQNIEDREEAGTPPIVETIRAGLVMQLKMAVTPSFIQQRNIHLLRVLREAVTQIPELVPLGNINHENRLPILSFIVRHPDVAKQLHHNYISALLNDLFGIQSRGGCACAGPYALDLLGLDDNMAQDYEDLLLEDRSLDRTHLRRKEEHGQLEVLRPGFVRINLSYTMSDEDVNFVLSAIRLVCKEGWKLLPQYRFNQETAEWKHRSNLVFKERRWLQHIRFSNGKPTYTIPDITSTDEGPYDYCKILDDAKQIFCDAVKESRKIHLSDDTLVFSGQSANLRWFLLPSEAKQMLEGGHIGLSSMPFTPVKYPLDREIIEKRPKYVWKGRDSFCGVKCGLGGANCTVGGANSEIGGVNYNSDRTRQRNGISNTNAENVNINTDNSIIGTNSNAISNSSYNISKIDNVISKNSDCISTMESNSENNENFISNNKENSSKYNLDISNDSKSISKITDNSIHKTSNENPNISKTISNNQNTKINISMQDTGNFINKDTDNRDTEIFNDLGDKVKSSLKVRDVSRANGDNNKKDNLICENNKCFIRRDDSVKSEIKIKQNKWHPPTKKIFNTTLEALEQFNMIKNHDKVLVCLSGGKDSLSLLHTLRQYQFYAKARGVNFILGAVTVDPQSATYDPRPLIPYLASLGVPYFFESQAILQQALEQKNLNSICSFCSRMKRGRIYSAARREGYNVLAFGQHLDDLAESFLMSVFHNGRLRTMKAAYSVQEGDLRVIRPFAFVREKDLRDFAEIRKLPIIPENCPACFEAPKERHRVKQMLAQQEILFPKLYWSLKTAFLPLMSIHLTGMENQIFGKKSNLLNLISNNDSNDLTDDDDDDDGNS